MDDEASTGKTFLNLHRALVAAGLSNVERVVTCVLTDWTAGAARHAIGEPVTAVSLLTGSYQFHEDQSAPSGYAERRHRFHGRMAALAPQ